MADVLDIDNAEEFEVDEEGDRKYMLDTVIWKPVYWLKIALQQLSAKETTNYYCS
jgi:hypothetical protein